MSSIKLEGKRITLRDWLSHDMGAYKIWNTGHHRWMDFNGPYYAKMNADELQKDILNIQHKIKQGLFSVPRKTLVIAWRDSNQLLGTCNWYWQSEETYWMSQGLVLYDPESWSKGIGYEALGIWCEYLLKNFPELARLDLRTWSGNHGMMKLALKLGFVQEACFKKARIVDGKYYDSVGYGVLREDWERLYPQGFVKRLG